MVPWAFPKFLLFECCRSVERVMKGNKWKYCCFENGEIEETEVREIHDVFDWWSNIRLWSIKNIMDIHVDFGLKKVWEKLMVRGFFMKNLKTVKIKPSDALFSFTVILTSFCPLLYVCGHYTIGLFICYFVTYFLYKKSVSWWKWEK